MDPLFERINQIYQESVPSSLKELQKQQQSSNKTVDAGTLSKIKQIVRKHVNKQDSVLTVFSMNRSDVKNDMESLAYDYMKNIIYRISSELKNLYEGYGKPIKNPKNTQKLDSVIKDFFDSVGVSNSKLHNIVFFNNHGNVLESNFFSSLDKELILGWQTGFGDSIFKPTKTTRFFHMSKQSGMTELVPTRSNSNVNRIYPQNAVFFFAVDIKNAKNKQDILSVFNRYGNNIYEYTPKDGDIFYLDKNGGSTDFYNHDYPPVLLKTNKPLQITDVTNTIKEEINNLNIPDENIIRNFDNAYSHCELFIHGFGDEFDQSDTDIFGNRINEKPINWDDVYKKYEFTKERIKHEFLKFDGKTKDIPDYENKLNELYKMLDVEYKNVLSKKPQ